MSDLLDRITVEDGKRGGLPCIRGMRIAVHDILGWLAAGMTVDDILADYEELEADDIKASLAFAQQVIQRGEAPAAA
jgi:uncharacterized protein (DUF433 family)